MVLEAQELGLGTCWIGAFQEEKVKDILKVHEDKKVVALLTVGIPSEAPLPTSHLHLSQPLSKDVGSITETMLIDIPYLGPVEGIVCLT